MPSDDARDRERALLDRCRARDYAGLLAVVRDIARDRRVRHRISLDNLMDEIAGVAGEIAFARDFALDPTPIVRREGSGPVDFTLACGTTIDVKASWRHDVEKLEDGGRLLVAYGKQHPHAYVWAIATQGEPITCELVGFAWADDVTKRVPTMNGRLTLASHRIPRASLSPVSLLHAQSDFWVAQAEEERRAAMGALVETQRSFDGRAIVVRWWTDRTSASVEVDGKRVGLVYWKPVARGKAWFDAFDRATTPHATARDAVKAVVARATGVSRRAAKPRSLSDKRRAAASGWKVERAES